MVTKQKILIVDDDENIAELISLYLTKECFDTMMVHDGEEALSAFDTYQPNLILLDLMLPGLPGEEVLPHLQGIPVIVLSARAGLEDKVTLLLDGAADYLTKPFEIPELLARIQVQLRAQEAPRSPVLKWQNIILDQKSCGVTVAGDPIHVTRTEYALLKLLLMNPGKAVAKSVILDSISQDTPDCTESSLKQHMSNLRKKLRDAGAGDCIQSVWGIGFLLGAPKS